VGGAMELIITGICTVKCVCGVSTRVDLKEITDKWAYDYNLSQIVENMKENGENYAICKNCNRVIDVDSIEIK